MPLPSWPVLCKTRGMRLNQRPAAGFAITFARAEVGLAFGLLASCAAQPASSVHTPEPEVSSESAPERLPLQAMTLRDPNAQERTLAAELRRDVEALVATGERNIGNEWSLAEATDHLAEQLEKHLSLTVRREGFVSESGALAQNLIVELPGTDLAHEVVLVGARFDALPGSAGADDNASGVAALLAIARHGADTARRRTLRLAWFSDAGLRKDPEQMGAWHHLQTMARAEPATEGAQDPDEAAPETELVACIELHGLGAYSEQDGSQRYAEGMPSGHPIAEFIEVQSLPQFSALHDSFMTVLGANTSLPLRPSTVLEPDVTRGMTAFRAFAEHGCPSLLVHDTHERRYPQFGTAADTVEALDFNRFARAVAALLPAVASLTNPSGHGVNPAPQ